VWLKALFALLIFAFTGWNLAKGLQTGSISGWRYRISYQRSAQPFRYWMLFGVYAVFGGLSLWMLWAAIQSNQN
jgi:hypothetical protein